MKTLTLLFLLLVTLAARAGIAPAFPPGTATFADAYTNNGSTYGPRGVAVADLFATGHPALIVANSDGNYLTVLTNNAAGSFGLDAYLTVGSEPIAVVATNINGSGHPDLIALNEGTSTVSVLTNNGAGGFLLSDTIALLPQSRDSALAVADIDNNGQPAVITASGIYSTLTVYTNAGGGIFGSNATYTVASSSAGDAPLFFAAADINGDGFVDLISASAAGYLTVLTNNGSGGFVTSQVIATQPVAEMAAVTVADIYNNGKPALITANENLNTLTVYTNAGNGLFGSNATCNVQSLPDSLTAADVNGDGFADLICGNNNSASLVVLTNNGSGSFTPALTNLLNFSPFWVAAANLFGNGKADLVTVGGGENLLVLSNTTPLYQRAFAVGKYTNLVLTASGAPAPAFATTSPLPAGVFLTDHGNGTATLGGAPVIGSGGLYNLSLTASNTSGIATQAVTLTVRQPPIFAGFAFLPAATNVLYSQPGQLAVADVLGTGAPAAIVPAGYDLFVLTNGGGGYFGSNTLYHYSGYQFNAVITADVYGTGHPALVGVDSQAGSVLVFTNNGSGAFGYNAVLNAGATPITVTAADIFGTGKLALITTDGDTGELNVFTNNGGPFHAFTNYNVGVNPVALAAADVNGDGRVDLVCANNQGNYLTVLTNNGAGFFALSQTILLPAYYNPSTVVLADILNNGQPAIITDSARYGTLSVYTNSGGGLFGSNATYFAAASLILPADLNNDGHLDLLCGNPDEEQLTLLTNNGAGHFVSATPPNNPFYLPVPAQSLAAVDINGDGRADLLAASPIPSIASPGYGELLVYTNSAVVKLTATENVTKLAYAVTPPGGYPAPGLAGTSGALPPGVTFINGVLSGTPNPGTVGTYQFFLTETNALGASTETIALTVNPVVYADPISLYTDENIAATFTTNTLLAADFDLDAEPLAITALSAATTQGGVLATNPATGGITCAPAANFTGLDSFTYTVSDGVGDFTQGTVNLQVYPPPVAGTYIISTPENTGLFLAASNLLASDSDSDGLALSITAASAAAGAVYYALVTNAIATLDYVPPVNFTGADTLTYTLSDGTPGSGVAATVQIIVTAPGAPPYNTAALAASSPSQLTLQYTGLPNTSYYLQSAPGVTGPWTDAPAATTDASGLLTLPLTAPPATPAQYYRISATP